MAEDGTAARPDTRAALIAAAERVVLAESVAAMTLDGVAREAGVSKGGLLYHFPSKEALIEAMLRRYVERFDAAVAAAVAADPEPRGRWTRAYLRAAAGELPGIDRAEDRAHAAITAALAHFRDILEPVREQGERHQRMIARDGLDPVVATVVRLAVDGLWLGQNFDLLRLDPDLRAEVCARLEAWTRGGHRGWPPGVAGP
jgi:AcrR family transcriptional regulator